MTDWVGMLAIGQSDRLDALREYFVKGDPSSVWSGLPWLGAIAVALLALLWIAHVRWDGPKRAARPHPHRVFRKLVKELGLPFSDRLLLRQIARHAQLDNPTLMLLSPQLMARYTHRWARLITADRLKRTGLSKTDAICRRLFDRPLPAADAPKPIPQEPAP
ncbi:MAG TPA: hypothetical protein VMZ31_08285 [Phycisphaerae bacterium]|nr:hypothetical protein [Phycisphaerae bacterium]